MKKCNSLVCQSYFSASEMIVKWALRLNPQIILRNFSSLSPSYWFHAMPSNRLLVCYLLGVVRFIHISKEIHGHIRTQVKKCKGSLRV